jgi:hypothetical protein
MAPPYSMISSRIQRAVTFSGWLAASLVCGFQDNNGNSFHESDNKKTKKKESKKREKENKKKKTLRGR